ncbi:MAG: DUF1285 domain-containing protein [Inquilinaceae bacterium]
MSKLGNGTSGSNDQSDLDARLVGARRSPPAEQAFDIRIARDGTWSYRGTPITRIALVKLFASVLRRDEDGDYWLITPAERGRITVDDAPFTVIEMLAEGTGVNRVLRFRTNLDRWVRADADHRIVVSFDPETDAPRPYIRVGDNLDALIVRSVYYELAERAEIWEGRQGVWSCGTFFPLDRTP